MPPSPPTPALPCSDCSAAVLLCGTDTLEEAAFSLHLMLAHALHARAAVLCITGAMLPADQLGGDGARNLRDALRVGALIGPARGQRGPTTRQLALAQGRPAGHAAPHPWRCMPTVGRLCTSSRSDAPSSPPSFLPRAAPPR